MRLNISIYPDKRYKSETMRFFMQLTWTPTKGDHRKYPKELPATYSIHKDYYNFKKKLIDGKSMEATIVRDRHFKLRDFVNTLPTDAPIEERINAVCEFAGVNTGHIKRSSSDPVTLRDFAREYRTTKAGSVSPAHGARYITLERNLNLFVKHKQTSDDMHKKSRDQQKIFFAKYRDFLLNNEVSDPEISPTKKRKYENSSVVSEFGLIESVRSEFESTGILINIRDVVSNLRTPDGSEDVPHVTHEEALAMLENIHLAVGSELKSVHCCLFQYFTGLRHGELYQVDENNISLKMIGDKQLKVLNYTSPKTGKANMVGLNQICLGIIEYWKQHPYTVPVVRKLRSSNGLPNKVLLKEMATVVELVTNKKPVPEELRCKFDIYEGCLLPMQSSKTMSKALASFLKKIKLFEATSKRIRYRGAERIEEHIPRWKIITSHSFRHGHSALLTDNDISIDDVGVLLNHADAKTTRKHYQHLNKVKILSRVFDVLNKVG